MFVLVSADPAALDRWRAAFDADALIVEVRGLEGLSQCVAQLRAQVVLLDARLARNAAARTIDQVLEQRQQVRILAFADDVGDEVELSLFLAGARGFCSIDAEPETVRRAVEALQKGELWIRRGLMPKLVDSLMATDDGDTAGATGRFAVLTPREIEIARLIGQGASNKRIARQLSITERTVKSHLTMIFRKTGADDRVKLALLVSRRH
jgi:DNA-binding NarL/FixJ family response regulator